ncbi:MAG: hypothetical protein V7638_4641 [Acidobacteriota bacterium]|jgi:hypothetical protein
MVQRKQKIAAAVVAGLASTCLGGFAIGRGYTQASKKSVSSVLTTATPSDTAHERERSLLPVKFVAADQKPRLSNMAALPIALRMNGFAPVEIERPAGEFFISVTNLTDSPDLVFRLDRENGERLHSANAPREMRAWRQSLRLTPGTYLLSVPDHPEWSCRITITAQ